MTIKRKLILLLSILFLVIITSIGISGYYVNRLAENSREIVQDNYRTLLYVKEMQQSLDGILANMDNRSKVLEEIKNFERTFINQKANITEIGEATLTNRLGEHFKELQEQVGKSGDVNYNKEALRSTIFSAKSILHTIFQINEKAVEARNQKAAQAADDAIFYTSLFALTAILVTLFYIFQIPGYLVKPIKEISKQMKAIASGNYNVSVAENRDDEFKEMISAFNAMSGRLQNFEKSNMAKLMMERNRLNAVVEQFDMPILGLSEENKILFVNERMLQIIQRRKESVIGYNVESVAENNDLLQILIRQKQPRNGRQLLRVVMDGMERLFSKRMITTDTELLDSNNPAHDCFIILDDVTDFIQKDVRKTQFMATLSHELKTPVAAIEMSADLLSSLKVGQLNQEQQEYVTKINEQTRRIRRMVNEVLDLSKIEAGSIDFEMEETEAKMLVEEAIQTVKPFLNYKKIRVEKEIEENLPIIKVDSHKVLWTLNNFLTNAIRYTSEEGTIQISAFLKNGNIQIEVRDDGPGISDRDQKRIFEKYVRLNKNEKGGTGLGLAISKEFIEAMDGEIGVYSKESNGATFWIQLKPLQQ